jgi:Mg2+-importing ATPase
MPRLSGECRLRIHANCVLDEPNIRKALTVNAPTLFDRLNFLRAAPKLHTEARDTDIALSNEILGVSRADNEAIWALLRTSPEGLDANEAEARLASVGPNLIAREAHPSVVQELLGRAKNPLNALLLSLATVSYFLPGGL